MGPHHPHDKPGAEMPFNEKALKLIDHWVKHNDDHAAEYRRWADMFRQHDLKDAADALESAARQNASINAVLEQAKRHIHRH